MSVKAFCLSGVVLLTCGLGAAFAQTPYPIATSAPSGSPAPEASPAAPAGPLSLSNWILYERGPGCCGPVGGDGPIGWELYMRTGVSFPIDSGFLSGVLDTGWSISGGARTLFFNPQQTAAWTVDLGIINIYNYGNHRDQTVTLTNVTVPTTNPITGQNGTTTIPSIATAVRSYNQTMGNLGIGKEWYLTGCADVTTDHVNWRVGVDGGGRYGAAKVELTGLRHETDVVGGMFIALHSDVELPWGNCLLQAGVRTEYGYTWSDILQHQNDADVQYINVLVTAGLRY